jgi:Leucine-rich repeat (LRR) protein
MRIKLIVLFAFVWLISPAQESLLDSAALFSVKEFTSLDSALKYKNEVVRLNLRKKKLKKFPMQILEFKNLQYLDISKNNIKQLPDSIVTLKKLQYLSCSKTGLESVPLNIGELHNLKYINLSQNEISSLPYGFGSLTNLVYADFWDNNLDNFPGSMQQMSSLKKLDLRNIIISRAKQEALQQQLPKTKIYFSAPCNCGG